MTAAAQVIRRVLPEIDERIWIIALVVGGFAALFMKEAGALPVIAACAGFLFLARQSPTMSLYFLAAFVPFTRMISEPGEFPSVVVTGAVAFWTFIVYLVKQKSLEKPLFGWTPMGWPVLAFAAMSVFSLLRAGRVYGGWYIFEHFPQMIGWLMPMVLFFLTFWMIQDRKTAKTLVAVMLGVVTIVALMAMWEYMDQVGDSFDSSRVLAISDEPNRLGAFFVSYMFLFLGFFLCFPGSPLGWGAMVPFLFALRGVMVTFSRGGYMAFAAAVLAAAWFRNKALFFAAVVLGIVVLSNPVLLPGGIRYRMEMTLVKSPGQSAAPWNWDLTRLMEASASNRFDIWDSSVRIIQDHTIWGVGFGAFPGYLMDYSNGRQEFDNAHNAFLMAAAEMGIPSAVLLFLLFWMAGDQAAGLYRRTKDRSIRAIALGCAAGVVGLAAANLFSYCFGYQEITCYFWMLAGLIAKMIVLEKKVSELAGSPVSELAR